MPTLKIDWDGEEDQDFENKLKSILRIYHLTEAKVEKYKTKHGYHLYIEFNKKIPEIEMVLLQCLLGSDNFRELYNLERVKNKNRGWNVLFKVKKKEGKVVSKEKFIEEKIIDLV